MKELLHSVAHDALEGNDLSVTEKIGGQEYLRASFEELFGAPQISASSLTLMQKAASVADLDLYKAAEVAWPSDPLHLYEELGGGYKIAGTFDRAKGLSRVGELLSGSRAKTLGKAKEEAATEAGKHVLNALKHDPRKVTPKILSAVKGQNLGALSDSERKVVEHAGSAHKANVSSRRSDRLGKVLKSEDRKVLGARVGAGAAGTAAVAGGVAAARNKNDSK